MYTTSELNSKFLIKRSFLLGRHAKSGTSNQSHFIIQDTKWSISVTRFNPLHCFLKKASFINNENASLLHYKLMRTKARDTGEKHLSFGIGRAISRHRGALVITSLEI
jgi:hypothetical protein